jgi:hypothetical protein
MYPATTSPQVQLQDTMANAILRYGVHLPPPASPPPVFQRTAAAPLMDQVIQDLLHQQILVPYQDIVYAFRMFLVSKSDRSARPILDLSPWTPYYTTPAMRLYSAAEVLVSLGRDLPMIKIDLRAGFFQIKIRPAYYRYYGVYYQGRRYAWTRLPMGHPLAPAFMQRIATAVARHLHRQHGVSMVAYLDDWLLFGQHLPVLDILNTLQQLGLQINVQKSVLQPTTALVYLGLNISTRHLTILPTDSCLQHLWNLVTIVPRATRQDLQRIAGYVAWLCYAMGWPQF